MISCSIDFYVRLFVRVYTSPQEVKKSASKLSHVFQCGQCNSFTLQPLASARGGKGNKQPRYRPSPLAASVGVCEHCGGPTKMCGPIWVRLAAVQPVPLIYPAAKPSQAQLTCDRTCFAST
jgi:tRNA (guanine26-N2/guanine27-N2)-dimethyltransferase